MVRNLPAMQETLVPSLDGEDPLEKGMVTCSSILARESRGQRSLAGCSPWCSRIEHHWVTKTLFKESIFLS